MKYNILVISILVAIITSAQASSKVCNNLAKQLSFEQSKNYPYLKEIKDIVQLHGKAYPRCSPEWFLKKGEILCEGMTQRGSYITFYPVSDRKARNAINGSVIYEGDCIPEKK